MSLIEFFLCILNLFCVKSAFYSTNDKRAISVKYKDIIHNTTSHSLISCTLKCRFVDEEAFAVFEKKNCICVKKDTDENDNSQEITLSGTFSQRKTYEKMSTRRPKITRIKITEDKLKMTKGHLQKTIPKLTKQFVLSFDIKPTQFLQGYASVLHFTTGKDIHSPGSRVPGIWFKQSTMGVYTAINSNLNYRIALPPDTTPRSHWTTIRLSQTVDQNGDWRYNVEVKGRFNYSIKNENPLDYYNVKCYLSSPWYYPQPGSLNIVWLEVYDE